MVPGLSIVFMVITFLITVGLPIALIVWVMKKYRPGFSPIAVGILVFFVVQVLIRIPLIQLLTANEGVQLFIQNNVLLYFLILSLTAGIFEEGGRLLGFSLFLKKKREYKHGLAYGIGHGGIEAILTVGVLYVSNITLSLIINQGIPSSEATGLFAIITPQLQAAAAPLINTPSYLFLIAGLERIFAIVLHIALSLMVLYALNTRKRRYLLLALLIHTAVNFIALSVSQYVSLWLSEGFMLLVAIASVIYIIKTRKAFTPAESREIEMLQ